MLILLLAMGRGVKLLVGMSSLWVEGQSAGSLRGSPRSRSLQQMLNMWGYHKLEGRLCGSSNAWRTWIWTEGSDRSIW